MRAPLIVLVVAALASAGGTARAEKGKCTDRPSAKRAFDAGHLAYRSGAYEESILKFQDSYRLCQMPLTLLAIANAYERLGDLETALKNLEEYRPHAEKGETAELDSRIATLKSRIDDQKKEAKRREEEEQKKEAKRREEEEQQREAKRSEDEARAAEEASARPLMLAGWICGGVGAATLVGSIVTGALSLSLDKDLKGKCVDGRCPPDSGDEISRLEALSTATDVLLVVGGALTAGGIVMVAIDAASKPSPSVGITLGPGSASLRGSF
jgi:hypothetical protein